MRNCTASLVDSSLVAKGGSGNQVYNSPIFAVLLAVLACQGETIIVEVPADTPTPQPTYTPYPTPAALPTYTPIGTDTFYVWANPGLSWSDGDEVFVALKQAVNAPATGKPAVTVEARVDETLTADASNIEDENGIPEDSTFTYQWIASDGTI